MHIQAEDTPILILSDNPIEQIWSRLSLWESANLARKLILRRAELAGCIISPEIAEKKVIALSHCVRNAREYLRRHSDALTPSVVNNYYGCMWLASALVAATPTNDFGLGEIEKTTKQGHGLGNFSNNNSVFPGNEFVYIKNQGFFHNFLGQRGLDTDRLKGFSWDTDPHKKRPSDDDTENRMVTIVDLFARIPEISSEYEYVISKPPLNFKISHHGPEVTEIKPGRLKGGFTPRSKDATKRTHVVLWSEYPTPESHFRDHGPQLQEGQLKDFEESGQRWTGFVEHPVDTEWWAYLKTYHSAMAPTTWFKPLFDSITDIFAVHLALQYGLSVLARYRPELWRSMLEGEHDQFRSLLESYGHVVTRVIPEIALRELHAGQVLVTHRGSWDAPL